MVKARDLMRPCVTISEAATVADVMKILVSDQEYCLAVVNGAGLLVGIITETDLIRLVYGSGVYDTDVSVAGHIPVYLGMTTEQLRGLAVTEFMSEDPDAIGPDTPLEDLVKTMHRGRRKVMLVAEMGSVLGAIHRIDVAKKVLG